MSDNNPVVWTEIYVQQLERAKAFYEEVLQVRLENIGDMNMEYWVFPADPGRHGAGGALVKNEQVTPGQGGTLVYFGCEDCAVAAGRAVTAGGSIHTEKMAIGEHGFISLVHDTEGNLIGLHSMQ
ncbi:VOC family protein [Pseudomonas saliphila]|uniref:VOC family protein n=1 Tax=Pseudomonas saliphila TaxID=2586906 RepID=UPI00123C0080|nr:VOC family protein [Pseudomonas saliphila]